jgi:hypothetical protein
MTTGFFHEDDYCQIEILPLGNWDNCVTNLGDASSFSKEHAAVGGTGWIDIFQIPAAKVPLGTIQIHRTELAALLSAHFPQFDEVESGTFSYPKKCVDTCGFGSVTNVAVFFDHDASEIVQHIWFLFNVENRRQCMEMADALASVAKMRELLLVDWAWERLFRLADSESLTAYLLERERALRERLEKRTRQQLD